VPSVAPQKILPILFETLSFLPYQGFKSFLMIPREKSGIKNLIPTALTKLFQMLNVLPTFEERKNEIAYIGV